jgi:hypothetical protein
MAADIVVLISAMAQKKQIVDVAVILADASPLRTLHRIDRLDVLSLFNLTIHIVDHVHWEVTKPDNDPDGSFAAGLAKLGDRIQIVETLTGLGFQARRARDPKTPSRNVGEQAVNEYAVSLARLSGPRFVPLVFYEDPDMEDLPVAQLKNVHMLNTTAFLTALYQSGILPEGLELVAKINKLRKTPMLPVDKPAKTKKIRSTWMRRSTDETGP